MSRFIYALKDSKRISIKDAVSGLNGYKCLLCGSEMVAKKGNVKDHHFAHYISPECDDWRSSKGEWHIEMQERFPEKNREIVLVSNGEKHIADILIEVDDTSKIVIEFQDSPISNEEFMKRSRFWNDNGAYVIWVFNLIGKDIRCFPDETNHFAMYRAFNALNRKSTEFADIIYYMNPRIATNWAFHKDKDDRYDPYYSIGGGGRTANIYFNVCEIDEYGCFSGNFLNIPGGGDLEDGLTNYIESVIKNMKHLKTI